MLTATKEGTFSTSSDPCVFFPLAASGVYPKTRVWGSKPENVPCFRATARLRIELRWGCEESSGKTAVGSGVSFKYDPFGRRIYKSSSAGTSIFAYDHDNLIEETNSSGGVVARYSQGLNTDEPLAMLRSGTTSYYQTDGLGSVTSLSNGAGSLAQTYGYDSFGKQTSSTGSLTNPFQYTAREFDTETNLQFSRNRYYDPSTGRFMQEDELAFDAGINFYPYVLNNPQNWIDPFGDQEDSVTSSLMQAIRSGNSAEIENILDAAGDVLSDDAKQLGREAVKRLRTPVRDLIKGSLKRSASYHSELEEKTYEEIMKDACQAAKQMKKLVQQSPRLLGKRLPY